MAHVHLGLYCHGGGCCGIKHIEGFSLVPENKQGALEVLGDVKSAAGQANNPGQPFYVGIAPAETGPKRIDRFLAFMKEHQPGALIEVTLVNWQVTQWGKILEDRGFEVVNKFKNSNSGNTVYVYHLITEREGND